MVYNLKGNLMKSLRLLARQSMKPSVPVPVVLGFAVAVLATWVLWSGAREATAQATPSRIGVVDFERLLKDSAPGKASILKLTTMQNDRMVKAKQMTEEIKRLETELKNPALTAAQKTAAQTRFSERQLAIKRFAEDADKEIVTLRDRELQSLQARIKPIIDSLGREMGMAVIFNKFESGLVYANDAIDLTNTVIVRFNSASPAPVASPRN
jgi:outer membrane protein